MQDRSRGNLSRVGLLGGSVARKRRVTDLAFYCRFNNAFGGTSRRAAAVCQRDKKGLSQVIGQMDARSRFDEFPALQRLYWAADNQRRSTSS